MSEMTPAACALGLARCHSAMGEHTAALRWATSVARAPDATQPHWDAAARLLPDRLPDAVGVRDLRVAVLGSSTTQYFTPAIRLAALARGLRTTVWEAPYGQYTQAVLDPTSPLHATEFDLVLLAVDASALPWGPHDMLADSDATALVQREAERWTGLWDTIRQRTGAAVVHHGFVEPPTSPLGHLTSEVAGSSSSMVRRLNAVLGQRRPPGVSIVDCDRLAATIGRDHWTDPRYWHVAKLSTSFAALPVLARHTAAVVVGVVGLARKCLVVDLDDTLWGGVVGEVGADGIGIGAGANGEAFTAFQGYLLSLRQRGVLLAVCSKNDPEVARSPFGRREGMRLGLDDFVDFRAGWDSKVDGLQAIASTLDLGLDALAFVDDNPLEREEVRMRLPTVEVIALPPDPAGYIGAVDRSLLFETTAITSEDAERTAQYRARSAAVRQRESAGSLEEFYADLQLQAVIGPFTADDMPRIAQLVGKTNQFNLTTRRHTLPQLQALSDRSDVLTLTVRVRDRFAAHGLVAVIIAEVRDTTLDIDTWLMSCRVIGRSVEYAVLALLGAEARALRCTQLRGIHIPTDRNTMVADLYQRLGFTREIDPIATSDDAGTTVWTRDLTIHPVPPNPHIELIELEHYRDH